MVRGTPQQAHKPTVLNMNVQNGVALFDIVLILTAGAAGPFTDVSFLRKI